MAHVFLNVLCLQMKIEINTSTQNEKLKLITLLCVSAQNLCIKILRTIFMAVNVETALDKMSSSGSVCVDRIFIMNRLQCV